MWHLRLTLLFFVSFFIIETLHAHLTEKENAGMYKVDVISIISPITLSRKDLEFVLLDFLLCICKHTHPQKYCPSSQMIAHTLFSRLPSHSTIHHWHLSVAGHNIHPQYSICDACQRQSLILKLSPLICSYKQCHSKDYCINAFLPTFSVIVEG